jgi:hypothetical protein
MKMKEELQKPQVEEDSEVNVYSNNDICGGGIRCGLEW